VKSYKVQLSLDGSNWIYVDGGHIFTANSASNNVKVENLFASPVSTRFVRIVVQTWSSHISMRSGVLVNNGEYFTGQMRNIKVWNAVRNPGPSPAAQAAIH